MAPMAIQLHILAISRAWPYVGKRGPRPSHLNLHTHARP